LNYLKLKGSFFFFIDVITSNEAVKTMFW